MCTSNQPHAGAKTGSHGLPTMRSSRKRQLPSPSYAARGERTKPRALASEEEEEALTKLRLAAYAANTKGPHQSRRNTVCHLLGQAEDSIQLSTEALERMAARQKEADDRSGLECLQEAKKMHVACGHDWSAKLDLCMEECRRGIERGIGTPRSAGDMRLLEIAHLPDERWDTEPDGEGSRRVKRS